MVEDGDLDDLIAVRLADVGFDDFVRDSLKDNVEQCISDGVFDKDVVERAESLGYAKGGE